MDIIASLGVPITYLALVMLVALWIARRRIARSERAAPAAPAVALAWPDPDGDPVALVEPAREQTLPDEAETVPRWLRPSVRAERFGIPQGTPREMPAALGAASTVTMLAFAKPPDDPASRRIVLIDGVWLLDAPEAESGRPVAQLQGGDEVEVLDETDGWANVLTPLGGAGWLPESALSARRGVRIVRPQPPVQATDAWTSPVEPLQRTLDEPFDLAAHLDAGRTQRHTPSDPSRPGS